MADHEAKADALLAFMASQTHVASTGHTFSAGWEAAKEDSRPIPITSADELWETYAESLGAAFGMAFADATGRLWIIGDDEDGYQWATSFLSEGDEFERLPVLFGLAPIVYPVSILPVPATPTPAECATCGGNRWIGSPPDSYMDCPECAPDPDQHPDDMYDDRPPVETGEPNEH
jgi:hypothetical protein